MKKKIQVGNKIKIEKSLPLINAKMKAKIVRKSVKAAELVKYQEVNQKMNLKAQNRVKALIESDHRQIDVDVEVAHVIGRIPEQFVSSPLLEDEVPSDLDHLGVKVILTKIEVDHSSQDGQVIEGAVVVMITVEEDSMILEVVLMYGVGTTHLTIDEVDTIIEEILKVVQNVVQESVQKKDVKIA